MTARSASEPPHLDWIGDVVAVVGQPMSFALNAHDLDQDTLTFSATGLPNGATLTQSPTYGVANVQWTPAAADVGTYTVTFTVRDNGNGGQGAVAQDTRTMRIVVRTANQAPVLAPVGAQALAEGQVHTLRLNAVDPNGDMLTYRATNLPPGATFDTQTGILRWTPNLFQAGEYNVTFSVTDGNASASETVKLTVANTNQAPMFTYLPTQSTREGSTLGFTLLAGDPDADAMSYSVLTALPQGMFFDGKSGTLEWTPTFEQAGVYNVRFVATDVNGASATQDVTIRVGDVNRCRY